MSMAGSPSAGTVLAVRMIGRFLYQCIGHRMSCYPETYSLGLNPFGGQTTSAMSG